jgi:hypothetical protein
MRSIGNPFVDKGRVRAVLKDPLLKEPGNNSTEQKPAKNNDWTALRSLSFKRTLFKLGLVDSPGCGRYKQAIETAQHVLCDCETLAAFRFTHLGQHFMKTGDFADISVGTLPLETLAHLPFLGKAHYTTSASTRQPPNTEPRVGRHSR